jgi:hypothetical protein
MSDLDRTSDVREWRVDEGCSGVDIVLERKCLLEPEMSTRRWSVFIEAMPAEIYAGYRQQVGRKWIRQVAAPQACAKGCIFLRATETLYVAIICYYFF